MSKVRVAAVQLQSQDEILTNLSECEYWISAAAADGAKFVVLPENFAYFGSEAGRRGSAELLGDPEGPIQTMLTKSATRHGVAILAGGWPEVNTATSQPYNAATLFAPDGGLLANYRKIHLFDVTLPGGEEMHESASVSAGNDVVACDLLGLRIGLSICYDLRFPELYLRLVSLGCNVLCIPAAFTEQTGSAHWEPLVRARAIESQSWVIAANQWGQHPGNRHTFGHSMIVDPWGRICAEAGPGVGFIAADISPESVAAVRDAMPCLRHRKNL
jgi:deaminated glutathione amidase